MEQGVLPYQESSTPTFQKEKELFPAKELNFTNMDENKKMSSLHEHKFLDLDTFQVNTSSILKKNRSSNWTLSSSIQGSIF